MSLINDALKRAREAQQSAPAPAASEAHFRPAESETSHAWHNFGVAVPIALALIALAGLLLVWRILHQTEAGDVQKVDAKAPQAQANTEAPRPAQSTAAVVEHQTTANEAAARPLPPEQTNPATNITAGAAINVPATQLLATTTNVAVVAVAPAKPTPPKLQGIVFSPKRPSALIDGRTLFVGDRLRAFRIVAISPNTVTLAGAGVTNILSLSD